MLSWEKLLSAKRRKDMVATVGAPAPVNTAAGREEIERDYDRILFAAPTRRLADKTQVYPMEENDSVRTRLTHSHEVSNLARSIGVRLAFEHEEAVFGPDHEQLRVKRVVPALLAATGLAHDLGNPPFGHQGEASMQQWFARQALDMAIAVGACDTSGKSESGDVDLTQFVEPDFLQFDGNAQTLRLLTRLQVLNDDFGLNLTVATLAALLKYPVIYGEPKVGYKKAGVFQSERQLAEQIWKETGLSAGLRHPLAYVMEACDDIAYSVIDAEDTVKKGYASFSDLMEYIDSEAGGNEKDPVSDKIVKKARKKYQEFPGAKLSSGELNDISMQYFRAIAISEMVTAATDSFVANIDKMMTGEIDPSFELIESSECGNFCSIVKKFDRRYGFQQREVLSLELKGHNYIRSTMTMLWRAVQEGASSRDPFDRFVYGSISENYRRVYESSSRSAYAKRQLVCDAVAGMTESYLINKHQELRRLVDAT